ncbi:MAG TPA: ABC transporter permease [Chloroflexota bacterium]|nr:ABC transporter permease [Chloroflexota bacterium]
MLSFLVRRLVIGLITLWLITVGIFALINLAPGGPVAIMNMSSTASTRHELERYYHLNDPAPVRYVRWLNSALHGNLGTSYDFGEPVAAVIGQRLPNTAILAGTAILISILFGIPLGILAAVRRGTWVDTATTAGTTIGLSTPDFWLGTVMIIVFAVTLHWLPSSGMGGAGSGGGGLLPHLIMPASVLAIVLTPNLVRFTRSSVLGVLEADYIRTARAKGVRRIVVLGKHAFRNALIPILSLVGLLAATLLGGSAIVESVFAWPGIGRLTVQAATDRDYPMIMGVTLLVAAIVIGINLVTDILYAYLDPRVHYD